MDYDDTHEESKSDAESTRGDSESICMKRFYRGRCPKASIFQGRYKRNNEIAPNFAYTFTKRNTEKVQHWRV